MVRDVCLFVLCPILIHNDASSSGGIYRLFIERNIRHITERRVWKSGVWVDICHIVQGSMAASQSWRNNNSRNVMSTRHKSCIQYYSQNMLYWKNLIILCGNQNSLDSITIPGACCVPYRISNFEFVIQIPQYCIQCGPHCSITMK